MEKNFEGKHFMIPSVPGRHQPELDCMFFPATHGDEIVINPENHLMSITSAMNKQKYLDRSTIIMCNPNALIY